MPDLLLVVYIATIIYFFLPHHILSRNGSRVTWLIRGFILLNALAYWVQSDPRISTLVNPMWQWVLRFFLLETCYLCALGALYSVKGLRMPRVVGAALIAFYALWFITCLMLFQTSLPEFADTDAALGYTSPVFITMRLAAALSTLILFAELTHVLYRFSIEDRFLAGRLRFGFFALGTALAFVNRVFVLVHVVTLFTSPAEVSHTVLAVEKAINVIATVFFLGGCLPPFLMKWLARGLVYFDQQRAILELAVLRGALIHSTAPLPWSLPNWQSRLREPTYVLYSFMIDVLDRIWLLESLPSAAASNVVDIQLLRDPLAPDELLERLRQMARRRILKQFLVHLPFAAANPHENLGNQP